jgi:hypothetical protein
VNHKYLGHILVLLAFVAPSLLRLMGLVRHNLFLYGRDPGWLYSDMNGFGPFAEPLVWFKLYWASWALFLLVGAVLFWVRGTKAACGAGCARRASGSRAGSRRRPAWRWCRSSEPTGTGQYQVTLTVGAKKVRADHAGRETEVAMDDWGEIGVFAAGEGDALGEPLYLERHRIQRGQQTIRVTVPQEPARAGIDPYRKLIDRQRDNNVIGVEVTGANAAASRWERIAPRGRAGTL